jgi:hypothetical protein
MAKLAKMQDRWKVELDAARADIPDKKLRWAIGMYLFNMHHDRGIPMVPSNYLTGDKSDFVPKLLALYLRLSGQPLGFDHINNTVNRAHDFVRANMLKHLDEERSLWATPAKSNE